MRARIRFDAHRWEALDRIEIEVPPTASPKEVMTFFAERRRHYFGTDIGRRAPGSQRLSAKHAELAVFAFAQNDGKPWLEAMLAWNEQRTPEQRKQHLTYSDEKHFARDARHAFENVTGAALGWKSGRGAGKQSGRKYR